MKRIGAVMILFFIVMPVGFGVKVLVDEKERISNMSKEEYRTYVDSKEQEKQIRLKEEEETREMNAQANEEFTSEMKTYETEFIHLKTSNRGSHATFILDSVSSSDVVYTFGKDLPTGQEASLHMDGRGEIGYEMKGLNKSWNRAGNYGVYHYESKELPRVDDGDNVRFTNLRSVEVTIFF